MSSKLPSVLSATDEEIQLLLAAQCHIGGKNCDKQMQPYVWKRRTDGIHIINIGKTWEKLVFAARVIAAVENPKDICVISARPYGQMAVLKFATFIGPNAIAGRFTPGTFTNQAQAKFLEPRLLIVTDPRLDHQPLREASYVNIPAIALCHTDSPLKHVDVAIPCNNKSKNSLGLMYWLLAREVLYLRGDLNRSAPWNIMVDLFFYREPEAEEEKEEKYIEGPVGDETNEFAQTVPAQVASNWDGAADANWSGDWNDQSAAAAAAAPAAAGSSWDQSVGTQSWDH